MFSSRNCINQSALLYLFSSIIPTYLYLPMIFHQQRKEGLEPGIMNTRFQF
ncbi:hypothetical protein C7212DRAFT_311274, partial [Tuber magnatum]